MGEKERMDEVKTRLLNCFAIVFPGLSAEEAARTTQAAYSAWDSVAAITLANVIEDEFAIEVDFDALPELDSFNAVAAYVERRLSAAT
jgi:acyl carrier protein